MTSALIRWFRAARRDLPWRTPPGTGRDPYLVLVSESMLQQTQVSRVIEKYVPFVERFPTVQALASACVDDVLRMWSGLGYYRRARNLHAAACAVVERHAGVIPSDAVRLQELPGVGRYTAGAVAAIAFRRPAPAVDGNIQRVLLRLEGVTLAPSSKESQQMVWARAEELVRAATDAGEWTEGLMELGATVCTPKSPRCAVCPVASCCTARRLGLQGRIPASKPRREPREVFHTVALVRDRAGRVLLEQRPPTGMWAGLWQAPTIESDQGWVDVRELVEALGLRGTTPGPAHALPPANFEFDFRTTHRRVRVRVVTLPAPRRPRRGAFFRGGEIASLGVSNLTRRVLGMNMTKSR